MAECVGIPAGSLRDHPLYMLNAELTLALEKFDCRDLKWSSDGRGLLLLGKDTFCCAFEVEEGQ
jgi:hypothetical protein